MNSESRSKGIINVVVVKDGESIEYICKKGTSIAKALKSLGFFIPLFCGGNGKCGKCKVQIMSGENETVTSEERILLTDEEIKKGVRLACRSSVDRDLTLAIPDGSFIQNLEARRAEPEIREKIRQKQEKFGVAIDIGTTTVVAYLVDLNQGVVLCSESGINPQIVYGADVISRIAYIENDTNRIAEMQQLIVTFANRLIDSVIKTAGVKSESVIKVVLSANTTMIHIFLGLNVQSLGQYPYAPVTTEMIKMSSNKAGINISSKGEVYVLPSISAFLGADIISGILSTGMHKSDAISLLIDLGTNGEIIGGSRKRLIGCASAAGPAFEGSSIKCGTACIKGAIDKVSINNDNIKLSTIGDIKPIGICGSGIIDITAGLINMGLVESSGRMASSPFVVSKGSKRENDITFWQEDIRQVQLAKAAIASGINMVVRKLGITLKEIDKVYLAGSFGSFLNIESAIRIGLIPDDLKSKIVSVGNSSGAGAVKCLLEDEYLYQAKEIQAIAESFELSSEPDFQDTYIENLSFR